jgi:hypothetical protein
MAAVSRGVQAAAAAQQRQSGQLGLVPPPPLPGLPPPMVTDNYEANATSCHLQVSIESTLRLRCLLRWCAPLLCHGQQLLACVL